MSALRFSEEETTVAKLTGAVPVLASRDVSGTVDFWTNRLGFVQDFAEDDFAGVVRDDVTLYRPGKVRESRGKPGKPGWPARPVTRGRR